MKRFYFLCLLIGLSFSAKAQTVADIVINSEAHTTLEAALGAANLVETLKGEGPFTVFAPTDDAFAALPAGTVEALLMDPSGDLTNILLNHVVSGQVESTDLSDGQIAVTLNGSELLVRIDSNGVFINNAKVTMANVPADNGVVHVIDAVMLPRTTVADVVINSEAHTTLEAALGAANLVETLKGEGPFTVFAPTDDAFAALPAGTVEALLMDPSGDLTNILLNHVVSGQVESTDLSDGQLALTLNGSELLVRIDSNGVFINNAKVTMANVPADNGVVHVIDAVMLPRTTVADIVINSEAHTTLEAALGAANLVETLKGEGPFTVFAPTDDAFAALPAGTVEALLMDPSGDLTNILLNHVVSGQVESTDLSDGQLAVTLNGSELLVNIDSNGVFINNAKVTMANVPADNGVVHVIDAVMLPRTTVADIVINSEAHTTLEAALGAANLVETLKGEGPFTVFAPTDDAFAALPAGTVEALLMDPSGDLTNILLNHVVSGQVESTDLSDGQLALTLNGSELLVRIDSNGVFINNAKVTMANVPADNGVVHVIDAVMLPRTTVADVVINSEAHTTLEAALGAANLVETLKGEGPFTVFAPTDAAFAALPAGIVEALLMDPSGDLTNILLNHVLSGQVESTDLSDGQLALTLNGSELLVRINSGIFISNAQVTMADVPSDNGVVHVIDAVIFDTFVNNEEESFFTNIEVYPNPTTDVLKMDFSQSEIQPETYQIMSTTGQVLMEGAVESSKMQLDISALQADLYILVMKTAAAQHAMRISKI